MICIIKTNPWRNGDITDWIIATDMHDARRKADAAGMHDLAGLLYRMEFPKPGKYPLAGVYVMLVAS